MTGPYDRPRARRGAGLDGKAQRQTPLAELFATEYRRQGTTEKCGQERAQERRSLKKSSMSRAHSSARTPAYTSGAGATRPSRSTS